MDGPTVSGADIAAVNPVDVSGLDGRHGSRPTSQTASAPELRAPTLWIEVSDLFDHFSRDLNPTGIQRVGLELLGAMQAHFGHRTGFCRLSPYSGRVESVSFDRLRRISAVPNFAKSRASLFSRGVVATYQLIRHTVRQSGSWLRDRLRGDGLERPWSRMVAPGDFLVCVGLPWRDRAYAARVAAVKRRYGIRYALLIHDVLPFTDADLCPPVFVARFRRWFEALVPHCDLVFAASDYSRRQIESTCRAHGWTLPPIKIIHFGAGFAAMSDVGEDRVTRFPPVFALFVSSIATRKNHLFLLRVWRELLVRHDRKAIPHLLLIGGGPQFGKVAAAIRSDDLLRGKVTMVRNPSDAVVREAYRHCLFTIFPSLGEGWGLPVAESLAARKLCLVSNRTSLPEVGGDLADYFDPTNEADAIAKVERALFRPGYLANRETRIAAEYHRPSWLACVGDIVNIVDAFSAGSTAECATFDSG